MNVKVSTIIRSFKKLATISMVLLLVLSYLPVSTIQAEETESSVTSVSVTPAIANVYQGKTTQLQAEVEVVGDASKEVTWTSSDNHEKVSVDANGNVVVATDAPTGEYTITATSKSDISKSGTATVTVLAATVPTPPLDVKVETIPGSYSVKVSFTSPVDTGGSDITKYTVTKKVIITNTSSVTDETSSPINITGLIPDTVYTFTVTATNSVGTSLPSLPVNHYLTITIPPIITPPVVIPPVVTPTIPVPPTAPLNVTVEPGDGLVQVAFTAPANTGSSTIKDYAVTATPVGGGSSITKVGASSPIEVTGLTNGTRYTFTVKATNNSGLQSGNSSPIEATPVSKAAISDVIVSSEKVIVEQGQTQQLKVDVTVVSGADKTVTWSVEDYSGSDVTVNQEGLVTVSPNAKIGEYTISAVSTFDTDKKGTIKITVKAAPAKPDPGAGTPTDSGQGSNNGGTGGSTPTQTPAPVVSNPAVTEIVVPTPAPSQPQIAVFNINLVDASQLVQSLASKIAQSSQASGQVQLTDVQGHWAASTIDQFVKLGIVNGYSDGSFHPNGKITRAEFTSTLVRLFNFSDSHEDSAVALNDISNHWAKDSIESLASLGIITGYGNGEFKPNQTITREEMIVILSRILNMNNLNKDASKGHFADLSTASSYAVDVIQGAAQAGIIHGRNNGNFDPKGDATRAEALTILQQVLELQPEAKQLLEK